MLFFDRLWGDRYWFESKLLMLSRVDELSEHVFFLLLWHFVEADPVVSQADYERCIHKGRLLELLMSKLCFASFFILKLLP